jgi:hypothetical protein
MRAGVFVEQVFPCAKQNESGQPMRNEKQQIAFLTLEAYDPQWVAWRSDSVLRFEAALHRV